MTERKDKLLVGPRLRRLRQSLGYTQAQMATDLSISTSYLNLIERNQRPMSAKVLLTLAEQFDFDISDFSGSGDAHVVAELYEVARDPILKARSISKNEVEDVVNASPELARAFLRIHSKYRDLTLRAHADTNPLVDREKVELLEESAKSVEAVREFINAQRNFFPSLDEAAEELAKQLQRAGQDTYSSIKDRLLDRHNLKVRILPFDAMADKLRYFDRHLGGINLSELLPQSGRCFQLAFQLAMLEAKDIIDAVIAEADFPDADSTGLARASLGNYFAAAILMPYTRFLQTAEASGYDIELLANRFGTSYEQIAHRLTTLQKPDARGVPFFFVRIDTAGNVSKRFSAGRFHFSKFGGACPLWNIHDCFQTPGKIRTQIIEMPDNTQYFSIARTVTRSNGTFGQPAQLLAVGLGCDIKYAPRLVYAKNHNSEQPVATPIGVNCYLCERSDCRTRAHAPLNRKLSFDERSRGISLFQFEDG